MQMMFFVLTLLSFFILNKDHWVQCNDNPNPHKDIDDYIFYDYSSPVRKVKANLLENEILNNKNLRSTSIKDLFAYIQKSRSSNLKNFKLEIPSNDSKGQCVKVLDMLKIFSQDMNNLVNLKEMLNEHNFQFEDHMKNLLILSTCDELFDLKCQPKLFFVSKTHFEIYKFSFSGHAFPKLKGFTIAYTIFGDKFFIYLTGGIDDNGKVNPYIYLLDISYLFGDVHIKKLSIENYNYNYSESSATILNYSKMEGDKMKHLLLIYGGINEDKVSNRLISVEVEKNIVNEIIIKNLFHIPPRKGHTANIVESEELLNFNEFINRDLMKSFKILVFGGKNSVYLNDIMLIKVNYLSLDDTFSYSVRSIKTQGEPPEPREGHEAIVNENYLYILGGCNYDKKKCFNTNVHRLNLIPNNDLCLTWETITLDEKVPNVKSINLSSFLGYISLITEKKMKLLIPEHFCSCANITSDTGIEGNKTLKCDVNRKCNKNTPKDNLNRNETMKEVVNEQKWMNRGITNSTVSKIFEMTSRNSSIENKTEITNYTLIKSTDTSPTLLSSLINPKKSPHKEKQSNYHYKKRFPQPSLNARNIKETFTSLIKSQLQPALNQNEELKKQIFSLIKEENENEEIKELGKDTIPISMLQLHESKPTKPKKEKKFDKEEIVEKNLNQTMLVTKEMMELKEIIGDLNKKSSNEIKKYWLTLSQQFQLWNMQLHQQLKELELFKEKQENINQEISKTSSIRCLNGYIIKREYCQCFPGYVGEACDIYQDCKLNCNNNGFCKFGKCYCNPGFSGDNCEITDSCGNNCTGRGICKFGKCFCDAGYSGFDCGIKLKCENNCSYRGICFRQKCLCEPGYTGPDCSSISVNFTECKDNCNGNGLCKFQKCFCHPGFSGEFCEVKHELACPYSNLTFLPCNGNGECKFGLCFCNPEFQGHDCSIPVPNAQIKQRLNRKPQEKDHKQFFNAFHFRQMDNLSSVNYTENINQIIFDSSPKDNDRLLRLIYCGVELIAIILVVAITLILHKKALI